MHYQPLKLGLMQECGSSLLKSLQNDSMIPLDLLVRESIQNSLDAATGNGPVRVDFNFSQHSAEAISDLLGGDVARGLRERYTGHANRQLTIRDANTVGLTGPLKLEELSGGAPHGNFFKLVYEVGRSQSEAHRGGSWGLGKTVYFRIGCGLVFFYSRIAIGQRYEERLAVCLVEDERQRDRLQKENHTGIGWWGSGLQGPLTDPAQIDRVLKALQVARYEGNETGTVIIVPFLNDNLGPPVIEPEGTGIPTTPLTQTPWWHRSYSDYVRVAIQRWYGVRLNNRHFRGAPLEAAVDGKAIDDAETAPAIHIARLLYRSCIEGKLGSRPVRAPFGEDPITVEVGEIGPLRAAVRNTSVVGHVAMTLVTRQQLGMEPPHNLPAPQTVLACSGQRGEQAPIVGFLRSPGMIVQWGANGDSTGWARKVPHPPEGQYLLALVLPTGDLPLYPGVAAAAGLGSDALHTLEGYLRSCEKADHNDWIDPVGVTIVKRMRERVAERLSRILPETAPVVVTTKPFLGARTVADKLLPEGFGIDGRRGSSEEETSGSGARSGSNRSRLPKLDVRRQVYHEHGFTLHWRLTWSGKPEAAVMRLLVDTEASPLSRDDWKREELGVFPLAIRRATSEPLPSPDRDERNWSISIETLPELPGIRVVPKSSATRTDVPLTVDGTLEVGVTNPRGAPVRSIIIVDRTPGVKS